jgi:adhesin transport system membrane fusion protein
MSGKKTQYDLDKISPWSFGIDFSKYFKRKSRLKPEDLEYMRDISEAMLAQATPSSSALLYFMIVVTVSTLVWASFSIVDEVTLAEARVIPTSREQAISSLEGGVLAELLVKEGDLVDKDQPLIQLDPIRFESQYQEGVSRQLALKAARARAYAEAYDDPLVFPPEVEADENLLDNETQVYEAKKKMLNNAVNAMRRSQHLIRNELAISEKLAKQGLFSDVELSRLYRQENDIAQQINERLNRYHADANAELVKIDAELSQLSPNLNAKLDSLERTTLKAPVRGIVKNIRMTTIGAAVPSSAPILDIVPVDTKLMFEAKEVSHVKSGLSVALNLAAYDSSTYGELPGKVEMISPDTFREDARPVEGQSASYYRVMISAELDPTNPKHKKMQIIPGMTAQAQIRTGEKSIMEYVLKPLAKSKEAFRER